MNYVNQKTGESRSFGCRVMRDVEDAVPYIRYADTLACPFVGGAMALSMAAEKIG